MRLQTNSGTARNQRSNTVYGILFMLPLILLVIAATFIPIVTAVRYSFYNTDYSKLLDYIGIDNYKNILSSGEGQQAILTSILYVLGSLIVVVPLGLVTALLLRRRIKGWLFFRTALIIPWVISQTVTALLWKWLLSSNLGLLVYVFQALTGQYIDFLNDNVLARISLIIANTWNTFPIVMILILAALQTIPTDYYEAATVDGVSRWQSFRYITLPLILPTINMVVMMQSIDYFNMVTLIYVMTGGGPFNETTTLSLRAYREGVYFWHIGVGSAYSVVIFALNVLFSLLYLRAFKSPGDAH